MLNVDNPPFQVAIADISSKEKGKIKCSMGMDKQDGIDTMLLEHPLRDTDTETINLQRASALCQRLGIMADDNHEPG